MATGTVKFFNETKGFGFIKADNGGEVFVHVTGLAGGTSLSENDKVEFDVEEGRKGPTAVKVKKVD
jgi:CspA family cold shock protein